MSRTRASLNEDVDLEAKMEEFMRRQAELESGAAFARTSEPAKVIGSEVVTDEEAKKYCREVLATLQQLKDTRDMSFNECKLVISIEDPRARERRTMGIEDASGVSRDEMASALVDVYEGRIPKDRVALKVLWEEITDWPFLKQDVSGGGGPGSVGARPNNADYSAIGGGDSVAQPYIMGKEARGEEKPQSAWDMLPSWVGYGALYGVSAIPVLLAGGALAILFWNALK